MSIRATAGKRFSDPFLYFKGFHALQTYRIAHYLWRQQRRELALFFQNRMSVEFGVDIHPAARIGSGIMLDHATSFVVGETAIIEDDVSILHEVTLGGTGKPSVTWNMGRAHLCMIGCVADGNANKEIADLLFISERTVKNHMTNILAKLGARDRAHAVRFGIENSWIDLEQPEPVLSLVA